MASFSNYATLTYSGGTLVSNTVTGEILETLSAALTAVTETYRRGEDVTFVLSLVNTGTEDITGLTVSDDMGGYAAAGETVYPLAYAADSLRYFSNGTLQPAPAVTAGPPMSVSGIDVPAGGNVMLIYEATATEYATPVAGGTITNTVTVSGGGQPAPLTVSETIQAENQMELSIRKGLSPASVDANSTLSYTFTIENSGNEAAGAEAALVLTDSFDPILQNLTVTYNGESWSQGVNYTYVPATGLFTTMSGQILVPSATYVQNTDGSWTVTPGTAELVISGNL